MREIPRFRTPVPVSMMINSSPQRISTQVVFPPTPAVSGLPEGILPLTPQNFIFTSLPQALCCTNQNVQVFLNKRRRIINNPTMSNNNFPEKKSPHTNFTDLLKISRLKKNLMIPVRLNSLSPTLFPMDLRVPVSTIQRMFPETPL